MAREFDAFALNGHNYPICMDIKIARASRGLVCVIQAPDVPLPAGATPLTDEQKYAALYIIRHHVHPELKSEYLEEEFPSNLFLALKMMYVQQKAVVMPEALHDWTHLRLQNFKSAGEYNNEVNRISSKLRFCGKEPTDAEKIDKTLSTMLPSDRILQQQYCARDYQVYSDLIHILLQAEKHDELLTKNGSQRPHLHMNQKKDYDFGHLTAKIDVYSFGLEMLSGRRALDKNRPAGEHNLVEWARPYLTSKRRIFRILDARLGGQYSLAGAQKAAALALRCLSGDSRVRPGMEQVVAKLEMLQDAKDAAGAPEQGKVGGFVRIRGVAGGGGRPEPVARRHYPRAPPLRE